MAENTGDSGEKKDPPKIKIGLDKELEGMDKSTPVPTTPGEKPGTTKIDVSNAEQPPEEARESTAKKSTSRIDLDKAEAPPAKSQTMRIDLPDAQPGVPKKSTTRIDVSAAQPGPPKKSTTRIDVSAAQPGPPKKGTTRIDPSTAQPGPPKKGTTRIDPSTAQPGPPKKGTTRIDPSTATPPVDPALVAGKAGTTRIELGQAVPPAPEHAPVPADSELPEDAARNSTLQIQPIPRPEQLEDTEVPPAAKQTTQRIIIEDDGEAPTGAPALKSAAELQETKKRTARIDLPATIDEKEEDILKRRTAALTEGDVEAAAPKTQPPKTIKLKRPGTVQTKVLPRQPTPDTIGGDEAKKSETARLDLPPDVDAAPPTRPKTIRIKRPDGTSARKPLTIGRSGSATATAEERAPAAAMSAVGVSAAIDLEEETGPGALYTAFSVMALLVSLVLVYVLLGQTYALDWPFAGRL